jgi:FkbM family methyltransferase
MLPPRPQRLKKAIRPFIPKAVSRYRYGRALQKIATSAGLTLIERDLFFDLQKGQDVLRIKRNHDFCLQHMVENFDYYIGSVVPIRENGINLVDMSGPRYHRLRGFSDVPFLFPSQTEPFSTTAEYLDFAALSYGNIVLDVGAYAGITSIIFAQRVGPKGHVYAFEADQFNYECAESNIEMAGRVLGLANITLIRKAIWSNADGLLFSNEGSMGSSAVSITGTSRGNAPGPRHIANRFGPEQRVPSISLQEFFAEQQLDHADFIKIDIEGCEVEVLESSAKFLNSIHAKLIVEPHVVEGILSTDRCSQFLKNAGFNVRVRPKVGESAPLIEAVPDSLEASY